MIRPLSPRQSQVLKLAGDGLTTKAIGVRLHIGTRTVSAHINAAMLKLGARSRTHAVAITLTARHK